MAPLLLPWRFMFFGFVASLGFTEATGRGGGQAQHASRARPRRERARVMRAKRKVDVALRPTVRAQGDVCTSKDVCDASHVTY